MWRLLHVYLEARHLHLFLVKLFALARTTLCRTTNWKVSLVLCNVILVSFLIFSNFINCCLHILNSFWQYTCFTSFSSNLLNLLSVFIVTPNMFIGSDRSISGIMYLNRHNDSFRLKFSVSKQNFSACFWKKKLYANLLVWKYIFYVLS